MSRITQASHSQLSPLEHKLLVAADRAGNADGTASQQEVAQLAVQLQTGPAHDFDVLSGERREAAANLVGKLGETGLRTLAPELQQLPAPLQRLALTVDGLWGNVDGKLSVDEIERVSQYYLSALPFFVQEGSQLVEMAAQLGFAAPAMAPQSSKEPLPQAPSVMALQVALSRVSDAEVEHAKPFRAMFDEAMQASEVAGAPDLLREAAAHSPRWHRLGILEHTGIAVRAARELSQAVDLDWPEAGATMLLHDIGKILDRTVYDEPGDALYGFANHEADGATWLEAKGISQEMQFQIHNHAVLRGKSADELVDLAAGEPGRLARMLVVYVSDQLAKGDTPDQLASFDQEREKIKYLSGIAGIDGEHLLATADQLRSDWFPKTP